jgi:hypothetical protein
MSVPTRNAASPIAARIKEALVAVEKAGYRIDTLLQPEAAEPDTLAQPADPAAVKPVAVGVESEKAPAKPVHPVDGPPEDS